MILLLGIRTYAEFNWAQIIFKEAARSAVGAAGIRGTQSIMGKLPDFSERLNKLKQSFLDSLPERLSYIDAAVQVIALETSSLLELQQALKPLRAKAHDMAGAAGTFGFKKLSELASEAEVACDDLLASNALPSGAERQTLGELLAAIRDCGSRLMQGAGK